MSDHKRDEADIGDDELLASLDDDASLENDPALSAYREQRLRQLEEAIRTARGPDADRRARDDDLMGSYTTIKVEKRLIELSAKASFALIHFTRPDFRRCKIMDGHLESLAPKHRHTLFLRTDVADAPFLVNRLGVKVLPCVIGFRDGNAVDRIVGFEGLGAEGKDATRPMFGSDLGQQVDNFSTAALEFRLRSAGVIPPVGYRPPAQNQLVAKVRAVREAQAGGEDGEDEGDDGRDVAGRRKLVSGIRGGRRGKGDSDDDDGWD